MAVQCAVVSLAQCHSALLATSLTDARTIIASAGLHLLLLLFTCWDKNWLNLASGNQRIILMFLPFALVFYRSKGYAVLRMNPSHSYGASPAILDHTMLPATWSVVSQTGLCLIYSPWRDGQAELPVLMSAEAKVSSVSEWVSDWLTECCLISALRHSPTAKKPASQKDGDETTGLSDDFRCYYQHY